MIQGKEGLLGLFLIIMGLSMFLMCSVYYKTKGKCNMRGDDIWFPLYF